MTNAERHELQEAVRVLREASEHFGGERDELRRLAVEQGITETTVKHQGDHLAAVNGSLEKINACLVQILKTLAVQGWKLGAAGTLGGLLGGGLLSWWIGGGGL